MTDHLTYTNRLLHHPPYIQLLRDIDALEAQRIYCRHNLPHFLAVARIAARLNVTHSLGYDEDALYLAALLHDVGRAHPDCIPHREESARLAAELLSAIDYPAKERAMVISAIQDHHYRGKDRPRTFAELLSLADNLSRDCYLCPARDDCYWPETRKNHRLLF